MNIKEARQIAGLTQKQLSERTGVPERSIQNWEAGARKCPGYVERMIVGYITSAHIMEVLPDILKAHAEQSESAEVRSYIEDTLIPFINAYK